MPRPGPRPYECVRRAWHSDRHQPVRGSLIQEIFRLANDAHNPATRKNGEWLEKLPLVVLKAEEIMYSKANSEAEYMDLDTLWDRTNEAIDTIIRRDDSTQTEGDLLQPCIEAALNLGCIPRRASRSQRHNNPECYLSSVNKGAQHLSLSLWYSALIASNGFSNFGNESSSIPSMDFLLNYRDKALTYPLCYSNGQLKETSNPSETNPQDRARTYPLCYSNGQPKETSNPFETNPQDLLASHVMHDFIGSDNAKSAIDANSIVNPSDGGCDLSLRLGQFSPSSLDAESVWSREFEDVGSSSSGNGSRN
ncbi:uncharacterized protein LOC109822386 isoform X2 [Asparagus officinalis]|uniref:uncharacterized protein LOC109822386 isoform X2 n=1 Tax=Asparagus officinalis TaxID=4686 RepID=UPI00098E654A|nr:uncharacterized protein LOC109822386 isoform X2 [Asparagus officinalis]